MKCYDKDGDYIDPTTGLAGLLVTDENESSRKRIISIPESSKEEMFEQTKNKGRKPDKISLSKEFFEGADIDIEVKAKVIYESDTAQDKVKEKAILMLQKGKISVDEIQTFFPELSVEEIEEVKGEVMQLA